MKHCLITFPLEMAPLRNKKKLTAINEDNQEKKSVINRICQQSRAPCLFEKKLYKEFFENEKKMQTQNYIENLSYINGGQQQ